MTTTRNPHDLRNRPASSDMGDYVFGVAGSTQSQLANSSGISAEDLDFLVRRKESAAFDRGADSTREERDHAVQTARREAWDAGHAAGTSDVLAEQPELLRAERSETREKLLASIEDQFGDRIAAALEDMGVTLRAVARNPRELTKEQLVEKLEVMAKLVDAIEYSRQRGFEDPKCPPGEAGSPRSAGHEAGVRLAQASHRRDFGGPSA